MTDIVERLRIHAEEFYEMCADCHIVEFEAAAEIERLCEELRNCTTVRQSLYEGLSSANKVVAERNTEIVQLRGLLREIVDQSRLVDMYHWDNDLYMRVREALGDADRN